MKTDPGAQVKLLGPLVHRTCQPITMEEILMLLTDGGGGKLLIAPVSPVHTALCLFVFFFFFDYSSDVA